MNKTWKATALFLTLGSMSLVAPAGEGAEPKNHLSLFAGVTHTEGDNASTLGLDYERRVSEHLGIGAVFRDHASGDIDSTLYAVSFIAHVGPAWSFLVAPGIEREDGENDPVVRLGAEYEVEISGEWSIAPALYFDIGEDETKEVLGLAVGINF